jgi:hypothetical protein
MKKGDFVRVLIDHSIININYFYYYLESINHRVKDAKEEVGIEAISLT